MPYSYIPFSGNFDTFLNGSKPITELPSINDLSGTDFFAIVNEGETRKCTIDQLISAVPGDPLLYGAYNTLHTLSANWENTYHTVKDLSGNWENTYHTVKDLSGNWESVYTTVQDNSANWESAYDITTIYQFVSSQYALNSSLSNYLPLTGGTITGRLSVVGYFKSLSSETTQLLTVPVGTTTERISAVGAIRYNTTYETFEGFDGIEWGPIGGGGALIDVDEDTYITVDNNPPENTNEINFYTFGSSRMVITSSGDVGIGATVPKEKLTVDGNMIVGGTNSLNYISFKGVNGDSIDNPHTYIAEQNYGGLNKSELLLAKGNDADNVNGPDRVRLLAPNLFFDTYSGTIPTPFTFNHLASSGTTRMMIDSEGRVGIGGLNPNRTLTVCGSISSTETIYAGTGSVTLDVQENKVGVNTETPNEELTVVGDISATGNVYGLNLNLARKFDYVVGALGNPDVSYSGVAPFGSQETDPIWNITKLTYTSIGTILSEGFASAVQWDNRTSVTYT